MDHQQLLTYLTGLPEVEQHQTWGHPTFRVRDKIFASLPDETETAVVKATLSEQKALIADDPDTFAVASRVGRYGWVQVRIARVDATQMRELVHQAWQRTEHREPRCHRRGKGQVGRSAQDAHNNPAIDNMSRAIAWFVLVPAGNHGDWWRQPIVESKRSRGTHDADTVTIFGLDLDGPSNLLSQIGSGSARVDSPARRVATPPAHYF